MNNITLQTLRNAIAHNAAAFSITAQPEPNSLIVAQSNAIKTEAQPELFFGSMAQAKEVFPRGFGVFHIGRPNPKQQGTYLISNALHEFLSGLNFSPMKLTTLLDQPLPQTDNNTIDWDGTLRNAYGPVTLHRREGDENASTRSVSFKVDGQLTRYVVDATTGAPILDGLDPTRFTVTNAMADQAASTDCTPLHETTIPEPIIQLVNALSGHQNVLVRIQ